MYNWDNPIGEALKKVDVINDKVAEKSTEKSLVREKTQEGLTGI
jgi:hypothetical protein